MTAAIIRTVAAGSRAAQRLSLGEAAQGPAGQGRAIRPPGLRAHRAEFGREDVRASNRRWSRLGPASHPPLIAGTGPAGNLDHDSHQMASGDIEYAKVGSSTLVLVESLRSFVHNRRHHPASGDPASQA